MLQNIANKAGAAAVWKYNATPLDARQKQNR
jgi:hypothetical protein